MQFRGKTIWILAAVGLLALALAAPAVAETTAGEERGGWFGGVCRSVGSMAESLAGVFGMSTDEFIDARQDGKSLSELAKEKGVDEEEILEAMTAGRQEALDEAVADGRITQEQADAMLERMKERMQDRLEQGGGGAGCGGGGRWGGAGAGGPGGGCGGKGFGPGGGPAAQGTSTI